MSTELCRMCDTPQGRAVAMRLEIMAGKLMSLFERWRSEGKPSR